jgi:hypothetical protein
VIAKYLRIGHAFPGRGVKVRLWLWGGDDLVVPFRDREVQQVPVKRHHRSDRIGTTDRTELGTTYRLRTL